MSSSVANILVKSLQSAGACQRDINPAGAGPIYQGLTRGRNQRTRFAEHKA